jgi:lipopolysaccharide export system permease protein
MSILTRYLIRSHLGPFLFAFSAVTGLLFLNAVAQRLEDLAGKGLGIQVIGEFMMLSLPHIVALTFPMSILVAVLYTFSDLTAQNEITAIAAGGIRPVRLLFPLLAVGLGMSALMFYFNDRVLPESNHRLSSLLRDVASKSPTFELREEVVNEVHTGDDSRYFLRARTIDQAANVLTDVVIYDLSRAADSRIIVAQRGEMAFTADMADLYMTLSDGTVFEVTDDRPGSFQRMDFQRQILPLRGVGSELERRTGGGTRSDREMSIPMLREQVDSNLEQLHSIAEESRALSRRTVEIAVGRDVLADRGPGERLSPEMVEFTVGADPELDQAASMHRINETRWEVHRLNVYRFRVEIHKKWAIAFACLIFVLLGGPFAVRFPQGGVGMVIATSVGIFFLYWMGLIGGERLADRGLMDPVLAMWLPNLVLLVPAGIMAARMGRQISTNRGGSRWNELVFRIRTLPEALLRRGSRRRPEATA